MTPLHQGWLSACVALGLGVFANGCEQDPDVVANVELLPDAGLVTIPGSGGQPAAAMACMPAFWVAGFDGVVTNNCRIKATDQLVALISEFARHNPMPPMGESRAPSRCESAGLMLYPDPEDPSQYILCEAACAAITAAVHMELARSKACMDAMASAGP